MVVSTTMIMMGIPRDRLVRIWEWRSRGVKLKDYEIMSKWAWMDGCEGGSWK